MIKFTDNTQPQTSRTIYSRLRGDEPSKRGAWVEAHHARTERKAALVDQAYVRHGRDVRPIRGDDIACWQWHGDRLCFYYDTPDKSTQLAIEPKKAV